ncbi:MAG: diguanylate cyclase [Lachnospiraceae bacterium]
MLNTLFSSALLLLTFTLMIGYLAKDLSRNAINNPGVKILFGLSGGILGMLLMYYSLPIADTTTLLDLRALSLISVFYIGGLYPSLITGLLIIFFRIWYFGFTESALYSAVQILLVLILYFALSKIRMKNFIKWTSATLFLLLTNIIMFVLLLKNRIGHWESIIIQYSFIIIITSLFQYKLIEYIKVSNTLYQRYKKDAKFDYLTGLTNRRYFETEMKVAQEEATLESTSLSCFMIDIDFFKKINDTYGHSKGDIVLIQIAKTLQTSFGDNAILGRVGGEEFCAVISGYSKIEACSKAEMIRRTINECEIDIGKNDPLHISISIGIAHYPDSTDSPDMLKDLADYALYDAKYSGRNKVCIR